MIEISNDLAFSTREQAFRNISMLIIWYGFCESFGAVDFPLVCARFSETSLFSFARIHL